MLKHGYDFLFPYQLLQDFFHRLCVSGVPSAHFCGCSGLHLEAVGQNPTISPNQNLVIEIPYFKGRGDPFSASWTCKVILKLRCMIPSCDLLVCSLGPTYPFWVCYFHVSAPSESLGEVLHCLRACTHALFDDLRDQNTRISSSTLSSAFKAFQNHTWLLE